MPLGLKRYQQEGDDHFITFSCYHRKPYVNTPAARDIFLDTFEHTRSSFPHLKIEMWGTHFV